MPYDLVSGLPAVMGGVLSWDAENDTQEVLNLLLGQLFDGAYDFDGTTLPQCDVVFNQEALPQPASRPVVHAFNLGSAGESKPWGAGDYREELTQTWAFMAMVAVSGGDTGNRAQYQARLIASAIRDAFLNPEWVLALAEAGILDPDPATVSHPSGHAYQISVLSVTFLTRVELLGFLVAATEVLGDGGEALLMDGGGGLELDSINP